MPLYGADPCYRSTSGDPTRPRGAEPLERGVRFPETRTAYGIVNAATAKISFHPLVDSGTVLLLTCIISYALLHGRGLLKRSQLRVMLSRTLQKTRPVAVSLILLLIISKLMSGSGQTLVLAQGITHVMGRWYALLAGVLGVIGSFVTGSNMSSNILFTDVQVNAAADLGVSSSPCWRRRPPAPPPAV